ncbi:MAG TPA: AAA family ATPase [Blastocatellia bacterium]|nr:AAA family ATPase [Blastocatellia bacterium]
MRIDTLTLAWFRGAAEPITLVLSSKSVVLYGENRSGKSSFVDAVEYVINEGKIGHLAHEYSGKHQEKGLINTHTPKDARTELWIRFEDKSELEVKIDRDGILKSSGADKVAINTWDYRRTVLRQDELANFIGATKGVKYSALLPLLGLHRMEVAAENLRQLGKSVEQQSKLSQLEATLAALRVKAEAIFGHADDDRMVDRIAELHKAYCGCATTAALDHCREVETAIKARVESFSADQRKHLALRDAANVRLQDDIDAVRAATDKLTDNVEPLIKEKLTVLQSTATFVARLSGEKGDVSCPACGRPIGVEEFEAHVSAEQERLKAITLTFENRKLTIGRLCSSVRTIKSALEKISVKAWRDDLVNGGLKAQFNYLDSMNVEALRESCSASDLTHIAENVTVLNEAAAVASLEAPAEVADLWKDSKAVETAEALIKGTEQTARLARAKALVLFINSLEQSIRDEIRLQSQKVIDEISSDIRDMWSILHPTDGIKNVELYIPNDGEKAIDIRLNFHGVEQNSPRLTLSESFRNSLGLCLFLAMAKREASQDRPVFLDDVIISLDRGHRGMIVELLEKEFATGQVIVLTHDREWYAELRQQLNNGAWTFKSLMPYKTPDVGIRFSDKSSTFDDARMKLDDAPDSAGNTVRKIMDVELALIASRLKLRLPYLHREKNDHRVAHDFLFRLISDGIKCFKKAGAKEHEPYNEAIEALRDADKLLVSWGNKSSHSFDVAKNEAAKLIDACETALQFFKCPGCEKPVYKLDDSNAEFVQCECGNLRWRYGKS